MQKLIVRRSSKESLTDPSSSLSLRDDDEFGDFVNESLVVKDTKDSIYTDDQVVIRPRGDDERVKVPLNASLETSERSEASGVSKQKKKKSKLRSSQEDGTSKTKKASTKVRSSKTKKNQPSEEQEDSPFWSLMGTGHQILSMSSSEMHNAPSGDSEDDSEIFNAHPNTLDESFVSPDSSILLPSKASMEANKSSFVSPEQSCRRNQRAKVSSAPGTILLTPSKASLERTESLKSNKSIKKKRRPKTSIDASPTSSLSPNRLQSPNANQDDENASSKLDRSDEFNPSTSSVSSQSQSSRVSQMAKSVSPKRSVSNSSLPPAIEGKPSSFSSLQFGSLGDCDEAILGSTEQEASTKIKQPSKARLESMLERVKIRKKTRKGSSASVGSTRRGKRPQAHTDSCDNSVASLDTGLKANNQDDHSLSGDSSSAAAMSVGARKSRRPVARTLPRRAVSYQSKLKVPMNADDAPSIQPSKASLKKPLKSRKPPPIGRREKSPQRSSAPSELSTPLKISSASLGSLDPPVISPKSIMKQKRRSSFGNDTSTATEAPKVVAQRRASFNGNSKHPALLSSYGDKEQANASAAKRRGVRSPSTKIRRPRSHSPINKGRITIPNTKAEEPKVVSPTRREQSPQRSSAPASTSAETSTPLQKITSTSWGSLDPPVVCPKSIMKQKRRSSFGDVTSGKSNEPHSRAQRRASFNGNSKHPALLSSYGENTKEESTSSTKRRGVRSPSTKMRRSGKRSVSPKVNASLSLGSVHESLDHLDESSSEALPLDISTRSEPYNLPLDTSTRSEPCKPSKQQQLKATEFMDAWWDVDGDDDDQSLADSKRKQLARKSVLLVRNSSHSMSSSWSFDDDEFDGFEPEEQDDEEVELKAPKSKVIFDPLQGRRVVQHPGGRRPTPSPGQRAANRRKQIASSKPQNHGMGSPQERQQRKVATAFQF